MKFKKIILTLLIVSMVLTSLPLSAKQVDAADSEEMHEIVEQQVKAYADSIWEEGADQTSLKNLLKHSLYNTKNEPHLIMDESDATTVSLMNSNMLQEFLGYSIGGTIELMQSNKKDKVYALGDAGWYSHNPNYAAYAYNTDQRVPSEILGLVANNASYSKDNFNDNDKSLVLIVGAAAVACEIQEAKVNKNTVLYDVKLNISDAFDFNGDYESSKELGYDTSGAEWLTSVGAEFLNEFTWETNVDFQIEVPYESEQEDVTFSGALNEIVEQQVKAYAESIKMEGSDKTAMRDLLTHSLYEAKKQPLLIMDENDATTSTLMNSNLLQESLGYSIAGTIKIMQDFEKDKLYAHLDNGWYSHKSTYTGYAGSTDKDLAIERLGVVASTNSVYGSSGFPTDSFNDNDKAMVVVVGGVIVVCEIIEAEVKTNTIVYDVKVKIKDDFDFNGDYESAKDLGYDTSMAEILTSVGGSYLNEFKWESNVEFQIEAPYECSHQSGIYQWTMGEDGQLICGSKAEGFIENPVTTKKYVPSSTSTTTKDYYYHTLDETVKLRHDKPWVMEYTGKKVQTFYFLQTTSTASMTKYYVHSQPKTAMFMNYETITLTEEEKEILKENSEAEIAKSIYHYHGLDTTGVYNKVYSKNTLRFRMENVVKGNSNMIYLSIYNEDTGETLLEPTPMDDYYQKKSYESTRSLTDDNSDWLSGQDFYFNHIGTKSYPLRAETFKLQIWENGEDTPIQSSYVTKESVGSCIVQGTVTNECAECGYTVTEYKEFAEHNYGQFKLNYDTTCTEDGTETAVCKDCGKEKTQVIVGSAKGHKEKAFAELKSTCEEPGRTAGIICETCEEVLSGGIEIPQLPHAYGEYVSDHNATCTEDGTKTRTCEGCGITDTVTDEGSAKGHTEKKIEGYAPECLKTGMTDGAVCSECKIVLAEQTIIPALDHKYGEFVSNNDATCQKDGTKTRTCELCGVEETENDNGSKKAHTPIAVKGYAATCTKAGLTDGKECAVCKETLEGQDEIRPLGHKCEKYVSNNDAVCGQDGTKTGTCTVCKEKVTIVDEGSGKAHTEKIVKGYAATCTKAGLTDGKECAVCKETLEKQEEIKPLGHKCEEYVSNNDAVCGQDGTKTGTCTVCKEKVTIVDEGSGQAHTEKTVKGYAATCTKEGLTDGSVCTGCGVMVVEQKKIEKLPHTEKKIDGKEATCISDGLSEGSACAVCNTTIKEQKVIKSLGHMFGDYVSNNDATTSSDGTKTRTCLACGEKETVTDSGSMKDNVNAGTGSQSSNKPSSKPTSPTTGNEGFVKFVIPLFVSVGVILVVLKKREMYR